MYGALRISGGIIAVCRDSYDGDGRGTDISGTANRFGRISSGDVPCGYSERFILSSLRQTETNNELTNHAVLYASSRLPKAIVVLPACAGARGSRRERSLDKRLRLASNGAYASSERRANRHNNSGVIIAPATRGVAPYNRLVREVAKVTNSSSL